jgi:hypothetical protein
MKRYFLHSLVFFLVILALNILLSSHFNVMGVQDDFIEEMVKSEFFSTIIFTFVLIASIILALSYLTALYFKTLSLIIHIKWYFIYSILFLFQFSLVSLYAIWFPQFIAEFLIDNPVIAWFFYPIIDHVSPLIFQIILSILPLSLVYVLWKRYSTSLAIMVVILVVLAMKTTTYQLTKLSKSEQYNVLILAADSFRKADARALGMFNQLKKHGNVYDFENVYTVMPRTFSSITSFFTAQYPMNHSVFNMFPQKRHRQYPKEAAIPRMYAKNGYETVVISDFAGDVFSRIDLGFEHENVPYFNFNTVITQSIFNTQINLLPLFMNEWMYDVLPFIRGIAKLPRADILSSQTINQIKQSEKPFFICTFFSDAHFPYSAPYPYYRSNTDYSGAFKYMKNQTIAKESISDADRQHIRHLFNGAEQSVKTHIDRILTALIESTKIEQTIVLFVSDHGENVYDYENVMGHGEHLYDKETTNIPFYMFIPEKLKATFDEQTLFASIDILPTINTLTAIPEYEAHDGKNIASLDNSAVRFAESGLWFVNNNGEFYQNERIDYPNLTDLVEIEWANNNEPALKSDYLLLTEKAKHRLVLYQDYRLFYIPLADSIRWRLFKGDAEQELANHAPIVTKLKNDFYQHVGNRYTIRDGYLYLK